MMVSVFSDQLLYENSFKENEIFLINGKATSRHNCVGYCGCCQHPGFLNKKIMLEHDCIKKECIWLYKIIDWDKKEKRLKKKVQKEKAREIVNLINERVDMCNYLLLDYDGIKITKVNRYNNIWNMYYVAICNIDKQEIRKRLKTFFSGEINLIDERYDFEIAVELIYGRLN